MPDRLKVEPGRLRAVAKKQEDAAAELGTAASAAQGVSASMLANHGVICSATTMATAMAEQTRNLAALGAQSVSRDLGEKLQAAAVMYETTDQGQSAQINGQMHPR